MFSIKHVGMHYDERLFQAEYAIKGSDVKRTNADGTMIEFYDAKHEQFHLPAYFGEVYVMNEIGKTMMVYRLGREPGSPSSVAPDEPPYDPSVYYGPHKCEWCGRPIAKASAKDGGHEFDYPGGPIYPNTRWKKHDCTAVRSGEDGSGPHFGQAYGWPPSPKLSEDAAPSAPTLYAYEPTPPPVSSRAARGPGW